MPTSALVATALTDRSAHAFSVLFGGLDIESLVPRESIRVFQSGSLDQGSSCSFTVLDRASVLGDADLMATRIAGGTEVHIIDHGRFTPDGTNGGAPNYQVFGGWLSTVRTRPYITSPGLIHEITCVGWDAVLDWSWVGVHPTLSGGGGGGASRATTTHIQSLCGNWLTYPLTVLGEPTAPFGDYTPRFGAAGTMPGGPAAQMWPQAWLQRSIDVSNQTLRSAIRTVIANSGPTLPTYDYIDPNGYLCWVSQDRKLWFYWDYVNVDNGFGPNVYGIDYANATKTAEAIVFEQDGGDTADFAYVAGSGAGTGYVASESTIRHYPAKTYGFTDSTSTTAAIRDQLGGAELAGRRSTFDVDITYYHPTTTTYFWPNAALDFDYPQFYAGTLPLVIAGVEWTWPLGSAQPRMRLECRRRVLGEALPHPTTSWRRRHLPSILDDHYLKRQ